MIRKSKLAVPVGAGLSLYAIAVIVFFNANAYAGDVNGTMKNAFQALVNLQMMAATPEKFSAPEHRPIIERDLDKIAEVKHAFDRKDRKLDPGLAATIDSFSDYIREARAEVQHGNADYARGIVRSAGNFCMSCHSRSFSPQDFEDVSSQIEKLSISNLKKGELFAATRQFERALGTYNAILNAKPETAFDAVEFGRALRQFVVLLTRVKQDDEALLSTLKKLSKRRDLPEFVQSMIAAWKNDAQYWNKNRIVSTDLNGDALVRNGKRLIERGESLRAFPGDTGGEISFLRATGYLQEALAKGVSGKTRGEALYLLGAGYAALEEPSYVGLDRAFFEACIRENPHSAFANRCYRRYLRSFLLDPDRVTEQDRKKLNALRDLVQ